MNLPDPVIHIKVLSLHPFGLFVAISFVLAYVLTLWRCARLGLPVNRLPSTFLVVVLGSLLTARLVYVAGHPEVARDGLVGVLMLWRGGYSLIGGLIGGAILLGAVAWARGEPVGRWYDAVAPVVSLALAVGMLGLPFGGEGWGTPTRGPFFMHVDALRRPAEYLSASHFHPIFAYEAVLFLSLALLLSVMSWRVRESGSQGQGTIGLVFIAVAALGYGALRPLSLDASNEMAVAQTQLLCALTAAVAIAVLLVRAWRSWRHDAYSRELTAAHQETTARQQQFVDALRSRRGSKP